MTFKFPPSLISALAVAALAFSACAPQDQGMSKDEVRQLDKADHVVDWCAEFDWYGDGICDDFCLFPDLDCVSAEQCGDGSVAVCEIYLPPCEDGLVREAISGCFGECVDPTTCEAPCEENIDCASGFCGWDADENRVCKDFAQEGESCEGFVLPEFRAECEPGLTCVFSEPTGDVPGTCLEPVHTGDCGDGSLAVCLSIPEPCDEGLIRETVNGCWGECVEPLTCLPPPEQL